MYLLALPVKKNLVLDNQQQSAVLVQYHDYHRDWVENKLLIFG